MQQHELKQMCVFRRGGEVRHHYASTPAVPGLGCNTVHDYWCHLRKMVTPFRAPKSPADGEPTMHGRGRVPSGSAFPFV